MKNQLFYGDNLEVLRRYIKDESVDLCYIDPPFNSQRNYNQIYNNVGTEDRAQAQAFVDTWVWDDMANVGLTEILDNEKGIYTSQTVDLIKGLTVVLKKGSLLAYLISMAMRVTEIHRVLKPTGSFYLHCDPTASHYLKILLDTIFVPRGGDFQNEAVWWYRKWSASKNRFLRNHDTLFFYTKSQAHGFNVQYVPLAASTLKRFRGKRQDFADEARTRKITTDQESQGSYMPDVWDINLIPANSAERLGYPTQKPEALLERIIAASSNEGDVVLDAYCGCGTTVAVAERLKRNWIGVDITYQSIALILRRLEAGYGKEVLDSITLNGIPKDMQSATALALKKDDRTRKEFEKWAVLTYSNNRAIINDKKGGDGGIDGTAYFMTGSDSNAKVVFQVKSGNVGRGDIAKLNSDRQREEAELAVHITLKESTQGMRDEANGFGLYRHPLMGKDYPRVQIVTVREMVESEKRLDIPMSLEVLRKAKTVVTNTQTAFFDDAEPDL